VLPIDPCIVGARRNRACQTCRELQSQVAALEGEKEALREQLRELGDLAELQRADIERYKKAYEQIRPNTPERVPADQLQLAFTEVIEALKDTPVGEHLKQATDATNQDAEKKKEEKEKKPKRASGGRRKLDTTSLAVEDLVIDPDEVAAANGEGYVLVGEEVSERVAYRPGGYLRLRISRRKWVREEELQNEQEEEQKEEPGNASPIVVAPVPENVWPGFMADPSAVAQHIIGKYDDLLPLHRQERISARNGFRIPRSTQCGWLKEAHGLLYRVVDAMFSESLSRAHCIATDATGAPVLTDGGCEKWHVFVFIADDDHVIFRYTPKHSSDAVKQMLDGFQGHLLADAAPVYDILYRNGVIEVCCWYHVRRYFWRALESDPKRALQALSLIKQLFAAERSCDDLPPAQYQATRAARCRPILDAFDKWVADNKKDVDPRGPLDKAFGYYLNQRDALHRFVDDGRLRLDNNISEAQLRNLVLGRHNWKYFANETGLKWYTVFRTLITSCMLHGINASEYIEQVLRLAPHWRVSRVLELSPKYWKSTLSKLDDRQRQILLPPWQRTWPTVGSTAPPEAAWATAA